MCLPVTGRVQGSWLTCSRVSGMHVKGKSFQGVMVITPLMFDKACEICY